MPHTRADAAPFFPLVLILAAQTAGAQTTWTAAPTRAPAGPSLLGPRTWIVDDDGGPGVHFTDIQPALDAAVDGDVVRVRPGSYSDFELVEALVVVAEPDATGQSSRADDARVKGVDGVAVLAGLSLWSLEVDDCTGTLVLDGVRVFGYLTSGPAQLDYASSFLGCADVRLIDTSLIGRWDSSYYQGTAGAWIHTARLEAVSSTFIGGRGMDVTCDESNWGTDGGRGLRAEQARLHLVDAFARGGSGGDGHSAPLLGCIGVNFGGEGGRGAGMTTVDLVACATSFQGGDGGEGEGAAGSSCGDGGHGLIGSVTARHSGCTFQGGQPGPGAGSCSPGANKVINPNVGALQPADPYLLRTQPVTAGGVQLTLHSEPGAFSRLFVGRQPVVQASGIAAVEKLVLAEETLELGNVPASGLLDVLVPLDPAWPRDTPIFVQAMSIFPGGEIRRTNSVPFLVP